MKGCGFLAGAAAVALGLPSLAHAAAPQFEFIRSLAGRTVVFASAADRAMACAFSMGTGAVEIGLIACTDPVSGAVTNYRFFPEGLGAQGTGDDIVAGRVEYYANGLIFRNAARTVRVMRLNSGTLVWTGGISAVGVVAVNGDIKGAQDRSIAETTGQWLRIDPQLTEAAANPAGVMGRALALSTVPSPGAPMLASDPSVPGFAAATPRNAPGTWVTPDDYPARALRSEAQGVTGFLALVGKTGRVQDCKVTISSGNGDLDASTCALIARRARFTPNGAMMRFASRIRWTLPEDKPAVPPAPGGAAPVLATQVARPVQPVTPPPAAQVAVTPRPATSGVDAAQMRGRVALVIGNARYTGNFGTLANPSRDADLIAASLRASGFDVEVLRDADQRSMKSAIARFGQRLRAVGAQGTGLFYYAGHGAQAHGENYLIPVTAHLESEADLDLDGVPADAVLSQMNGAGVATSIVILDACRNLPLARTTRSADRGLARMDAPGGSYIAYSTAPGQTAADGDGVNSPFAVAVAQQMAVPGQSIQDMFINVRKSVYRATGNKQTPWDSSSLFNNFSFRPTR